MKKTLEVIEQMKQDDVIAEYAIAEAVAAIFYVEPFATEDVDVFVNLNPLDSPLVSLEPIPSYLRERGYNQLTGVGVDIAGWPVQLLPVSDALTREALESAHYLPYDAEFSVRVVRPEYLAAEAIRLGRPKDLPRIASLLEADTFNHERFTEVIERHGLAARWTRVQAALDWGQEGPSLTI